MNKITIALVGILLWAPLVTPEVVAQDRYISDVLFVPLRSGMGNQFRIVHQGLRSGTPLELIREAEADDGEEWSLVRTQDDQEGWIRSQFLLSEPTAAQKLSQAESRAETLAQEKRQLEERIGELREENSSLEQALEELRVAHDNLRAETEQVKAVSADALNLHEQHQELNEAYQLLQTRADVLQAENEQLTRDRRYYDWLFGGGILLAGVILSLILQAIGKRRRKSEWG